jgi:hypothetical protein
VIALVTSASSIWWWLSAAAAGAVGGVTIGALLAVERDDGEIHDARTAKSGVGDADTPVEGAERQDRRQAAPQR